ncbi:hypothetical protein KP509_34G008200 [Ceratopteris richardii]|uniref:DUF7705 domain-containing protein n=1 Tax=Ceratopteris richardii TaxID=49495 RepID=A0A8T2QI70_CERRI|nr:hypothetical protein KP509_34G008200 [Ceratopteris richardii]
MDSAFRLAGAACEVEQLVNVADDGLKSGQTFPQGDFVDYVQPDDYAVQKELYLASLCETTSEAGPWHFWMVMLKNGNFDIHSGLCSSTASSPSQSRPFMFYPGKITTSSVASGRYLNPQMTQMPAGDKESQNIPQLGPIVSRNISTASSNAAESMPLPSIVQALLKSANPVDNLYRQQQQEQMLLPPFIANKGSFPCFGHGCMNHPRVFHNWSKINDQEGYTNSSEFISSQTLSGSFFGTYDLDDNGLANQTVSLDSSYFSVDWSKDPQSGSWLFHHVLRVNHKYPWLMLYLRADTTSGLSGGYPWETRGMMIKVPESPNFKVKLTLNVLRGGGSASQFYLLDIGGCWKNDGRDCDGNTSSDVTRYSEMIINPSTTNWCHPGALALCPPYHVDAKTKEHIYRNDTARFPYTAYHYYCVPPNAQYAEEPFNVCDPYSNPQPQEIMQLLPHPEWAIHGYPSAKGQGWIGDSKSWTLDVGGLSQRLYFYQDPGTKPAPRRWTSVDVGTEIFISQRMETAEWIVSDFDVLSADC